MRVARLGAIDVPTLLTLLLGSAVCYSAWLTSIVFCAASGLRPLLIASAAFSRLVSSMVLGCGLAAGDRDAAKVTDFGRS